LQDTTPTVESIVEVLTSTMPSQLPSCSSLLENNSVHVSEVFMQATQQNQESIEPPSKAPEGSETEQDDDGIELILDLDSNSIKVVNERRPHLQDLKFSSTSNAAQSEQINQEATPEQTQPSTVTKSSIKITKIDKS
jgi:hypothetical protein